MRLQNLLLQYETLSKRVFSACFQVSAVDSAYLVLDFLNEKGIMSSAMAVVNQRLLSPKRSS